MVSISPNQSRFLRWYSAQHSVSERSSLMSSSTISPIVANVTFSLLYNIAILHFLPRYFSFPWQSDELCLPLTTVASSVFALLGLVANMPLLTLYATFCAGICIGRLVALFPETMTVEDIKQHYIALFKGQNNQ